MNKGNECGVCYITYDENEHRPRTLPCGHTYCSACITTMMTNSIVSCPNCCICHPITSIDQFPINYGMETLLWQMKTLLQQVKEAQMTQETSVALDKTNEKDATEAEVPVKTDVTDQKRPAGLNRKLWSVVEEQKSSVSSLVSGCQDTQSQLDQYWAQLTEWSDQHLKLEERLQALLQKNKAAVMLIEQEKARVVAMKQEGEEAKKKLEATLECLQGVNTAEEAGSAINHADLCIVGLEGWRQKCHDHLPDINTFSTSWKVREAIRTALDVVKEGSDVTHSTDLPPLPDLASSIKSKLIKMTELLGKVTVGELCRMSLPIIGLLVTGRVVAVQDEGRLRFSKISLEKGKVYLHCLQDQTPSSYTHTLPFSEVVEAVDPSSTLAFLDLGWGGSTRGRVHIRLSPNTPASQQFTLLCTGQRRHSYRNTKLMRVWSKGKPGEGVWVGYYDGKDGESLLPLTGVEYRTSGKAGDVLWMEDDTKGVRFGIVSRDRGNNSFSNVFGVVESGLEVVRAAVNHSDPTQVSVVECGIVLNE